MARFVKGDVVIVPCPCSDLTQTKRRPALSMQKAVCLGSTELSRNFVNSTILPD